MRTCIGMVLVGCLLVSGCDPFKEQREAAAEKKRIECLDRFCEGDDPGVPPSGHRYLKLNGTKYLAPAAYVKGFAGLSFYWPSKTPVAGREDGGPYPERGQDYSAIAVDIFLTGRASWPDPKAERPWEGRGWEGRFEELQSQGLRIEREHLTPELERVRFFDAQGKQYLYEIFLASQQQKPRGNGLPGVSCDLYPDPRPNARPRCNGAFFWQEDVYADFRFHAKHAKDWPAIHQEIVRVLILLKKVPQ